jgi:putative hydrolase of the HAD superfamily
MPHVADDGTCEMLPSAHLTVDPADVDVVLLDAGGVLLVPDPAAIISTFVPFGGTDDVAHAIRAHFQAMAPLTPTDGFDEAEWSVYRRELAAACGVPVERCDEASGIWYDMTRHTNVWTHPIPLSRDGLARLAKNFRVGIVSNSDGSVAGTLASAGICQVGAGAGVEVEFVVDSHVVGVAKPDPRIFDIALARLGVGPDVCVYAGDLIGADVAGARAASIHPVHIDPYGDCPQRGDRDHDHATGVSDLADKLLAARS